MRCNLQHFCAQKYSQNSQHKTIGTHKSVTMYRICTIPITLCCQLIIVVTYIAFLFVFVLYFCSYVCTYRVIVVSFLKIRYPKYNCHVHMSILISCILKNNSITGRYSKYVINIKLFMQIHRKGSDIKWAAFLHAGVPIKSVHPTCIWTVHWAKT